MYDTFIAPKNLESHSQTVQSNRILMSKITLGLIAIVKSRSLIRFKATKIFILVLIPVFVSFKSVILTDILIYLS